MDNGELCVSCKSTKVPTGILTNNQLAKLKGKKYQRNLDSYEHYLIDRNYEQSTALSYKNALRNIGEYENTTFHQMIENINKLTYDYGLNGIKRDLGERSKGTWRCSLDRLKDFKEYLLIYNESPLNINPNVEQIKAIVTQNFILSVLKKYFTEEYTREEIEQALNKINIRKLQ